MNATIPVSACVISYNEAGRIGDCLRSLAFCADRLVVDSHSTDGTREEAAAAGARVIERDWPGYRSQKQYAVEQAQHDWVLCLDADERVSPELEGAIRAVYANGAPTAAAYRFANATRYFGAYLKHGNIYPARITRLFDRRRARWAGREIHETVEVDGPTVRLTGDLLHHAYRDYEDQLGRWRQYARLMAEHQHRAGERVGAAAVIGRPLWRFLRGYLLRQGFRDGWRGFLYASTEAHYVLEKYLRLYQLGAVDRDPDARG